MLQKRVKRTIGMAKALREKQTKTERTLWKLLRAHRFHAFKFRRQYPIGPWIADFACPERKLIVEIDGGDHSMRKWKDQRRDDALKRDGFLVLRFTNVQVQESRNQILETIHIALEVDRSS